jgi:hypothetical protein
VILAPGDCADSSASLRAAVLDMNEDALRIHLPVGLHIGASARVRLEIEVAPGKERACIRSANCTAVVTRRRRCQEGFDLVLRLTPSSARSHYVIHQYFLENSLARRRPAATKRDLSLERREEIRAWLAASPDASAVPTLVEQRVEQAVRIRSRASLAARSDRRPAGSPVHER